MIVSVGLFRLEATFAQRKRNGNESQRGRHSVAARSDLPPRYPDQRGWVVFTTDFMGVPWGPTSGV